MSDKILVVDDEQAFSGPFARFLQDEGFECLTAPDGETAVKMLSKQNFDIVFTDINMPGMSGIDVLKKIGQICPDTFTIIITAYGSYETAVDAIRNGAFDYIAKPINFDDAMFRIRRIVDHRDRLTEIKLLKRDLRRTHDFENIVGETPKMQEVFGLIRKVAATKSTVLITGESGTGKELVARAVHYTSEETRNRRFVPVNCAAISEHLLESELFGHVKGSFTGAVSDKKGLFQVAEGGSIFLDEIGEMSPMLQAKLLRAIQEREIVRVGGTDPIRVDVRVLCSTNRDLKKMVDEGGFREDLYYRINVVDIHLPPLRERVDDIPLLVSHLVERFGRELKRPYQGVDNDAMRVILAYEWKGNVRELLNVLERAMILGDGDRIRLKDLPESFAGLAPVSDTDDLKGAVRDFESRHIERILEKAGGNKEDAAKRMGIGLSSLYRKIDELGLREASPSSKAGA